MLGVIRPRNVHSCADVPLCGPVGSTLSYMRFLRLEDVAEELNVKLPQVRSLVKSGELPAIQIGGRGMWRVERVELENYIQRRYSEAREEIAKGLGED